MFKAARLASEETNVTTTNASTFHIDGAPIAGNNMIISKPAALRVSNGVTILEDEISVAGKASFSGDVTFDGEMTTTEYEYQRDNFRRRKLYFG